MSTEDKATTAEVLSISNKLQTLSVNDGQDREGEAGEPVRTDEDYAQSPLTLRAIVSSKEAGVIIGKAGKNVADLRDETGVKAGVSKVVPGVHDRVLTVTGNLDGVAKAYAMVAQTLVDSPPGAIPTTPMGTHPVRLLISHNQMGTIIGRQGLKIKHIQDVSGVRMVAQKEMLPQSTERIVEVQGSADGIRQAVWEIGKCLVDDWQRGTGTILYNPAVRSNTSHGTGSSPSVISNGGAGNSGPTDRFTNERPNRGPVRTGNGTDFSEPSPSFPRRGHSDSTSRASAPAPNAENGEELQTQNISIPADMVGCIIGRGGSKISEIRKSSGARISIAKAPHDDTGERMFTIVGSPQSNEKALYLLYENLEAEKTRRSQGSGQD
ncbi:RNA binding protein, heterogenous nuclear RNP-K like protein [Arthrobotrys conoides]|uniref:RNA binding protein, heterogenous nuclear RNP-K like protein n=1 Tax=Arthrobotrys conoides TaxID=74498 RepID=A0AAN8RQ81_9PEZI